MVQLFPTTYSMAETHSYSTLDDDEIEVNYIYMQFSKSFRVYIQMHELDERHSERRYERE